MLLGKTFLYNTIIRWVLANKPPIIDFSLLPDNSELRRGSVIATASTGIAALLLIGGGTVHRNFNVPNDVNSDTLPRMSATSARAEQIRRAELIIIDVLLVFFVLIVFIHSILGG